MWDSAGIKTGRLVPERPEPGLESLDQSNPSVRVSWFAEEKYLRKALEP